MALLVETRTANFETAQFSRESNDELLRQSLEADGFIFFDKGPHTAPPLNMGMIHKNVNPDYIDQAVKDYNKVSRFINAVPIGDPKHQASHEERKIFCDSMEEKYGEEVFNKVCRENNAFRTNLINLSIFTIGNFSFMTQETNPGISARLGTIGEQMEAMLYGEHEIPELMKGIAYDHLTLEDKYAMVLNLKAQSVHALNVLQTNRYTQEAQQTVSRTASAA